MIDTIELDNKKDLKSTEQSLNLKAIFNRNAYFIKMFMVLVAVMLFFSIGFNPQKISILEFIATFSVIILTPGLLYMLYLIYYYKNLKYIVREDSISCISTFMGYAEKDLSYLEVREVQYGQTFFQKMFGLGNVYMSSNANTGMAGVAIIDIRDSEAIYREMKRRVAAAKALDKQNNSDISNNKQYR